jgi:hypothetical protein
MDDLGWKFWLQLAGLFAVGAVVLFIFLIFLLKAVYAFGILGALLLMAGLALLAGWIFDRRQERRRASGY